MKKFVLLFCIVFMIQETQAQFSKYIIRFRDKGTNPFSIANPSAYLSQRAIARRTAYNVTIDSTDLPVTPRYIDSLQMAGAVTILNVSKWLNSVTIQTTDAAALSKINSFPFVISSAPAAPKNIMPSGLSQKKGIQSFNNKHPYKLFSTLDLFSYGLSARQVRMHNANFLHDIGLRGQGIVIGILDAGFNNYLTVSSLDSARTNGQILGTWDFVDRHVSVNENNQHGMQVFSVIGANLPNQFIGTAPKASFYLFRSEDAGSEYIIEEHNWVCAAERVDSSGGDMINSSLGYNIFDDPSMSHSFNDMNGNITMAAVGADLAAKKGILVVNSAGNEGLNSWGRIITPADGDSVLAVGAVDSVLKPANFTSRGPSADGQVKPDVASMGVATIVQWPNNAIAPNNGTSFSAPNMAGVAACLWQGFREYNNMKIIDALRKAGHRANNPNDTVGYGVPDAKLALIRLTKEFSTATAAITNCKTTITGTSKDMKAMKYEVERKLETQSGYVKVGEFNGTGAVFNTRNYVFTDSLVNVSAGNISYRVRQIFDTAASSLAFEYIDTVNLTLTASCIFTSVDPVIEFKDKVELLPNPARENLGIRISTTQAVPELNILIRNSYGQLVKQLRYSKPAGTTRIDINIKEMTPGKYYISTYSGNRLIETSELIRL
jgi:serine protease AprX